MPKVQLKDYKKEYKKKHRICQFCANVKRLEDYDGTTEHLCKVVNNRPNFVDIVTWKTTCKKWKPDIENIKRDKIGKAIF